MPSAEDIESEQLGRLRTLVEQTLASNPFYGARLREAGIDAAPGSVAEFLERAPFTEKADFVADQQANPPYGTNRAFPLEEYRRMHQTSGTTSKPLRWLDTGESWSAMLDGWVRVLEASGVTAEDRVLFPFAFGPFCGFWMAFEAAVRMGCLALPGGGLRSAGRLQMMLDNEATAFCSTPTYAIRLGQTLREEGFDPADFAIRTIIPAGEPGAGIPATRAKIEELWPEATIKDHHGMTEVGPVTYECPAVACRLHVMESSFLAEVLDTETLEPVGPGETGELVLTTLDRVAAPAIRYRTRDMVQRAAAGVCACGSAELALDGGILGRTDDMVTVRGVNLYPSGVEAVVRGERGAGEYRVEISDAGGLKDVRLLVEPEGEGVGDLVGRLEGSLHKAFGLRFAVEAVEVGSLPRFEAKAKRWIRV